MKPEIVLGKRFVPLFTDVQIEARIQALAVEINAFYEGKAPVLLPVLTGAFIFAADLMRHLTVKPEVDFVRVSTYGEGMESSGKATNLLPASDFLKDRHVLLVEDIVDSGFTCDYLHDHLASIGPASIKMASLLYKPANFRGVHKPDWVGFEIPPAFVIGYGLDYASKARELPGIYVWDEKE